MNDLAEQIRASVKDPNIEPWLPELTFELTTRAWDCVHRDLGLTPDSYGTERVLSHSISAPREIIGALKPSLYAGGAAQVISIEGLTQRYAAGYKNSGVSFYSPDTIKDSTVLSCIEDAVAIINQVPSLMRTVASLVRSIHVIQPEDEDHDVSFSEPHVPFSIFVSVPQVRIASDALRVAESIVHEAMHLQLTIIEKVICLVSSTTSKHYSPWKKEYRDARGVLHAVYVFSVIDRFLAALDSMTSSEGPVAEHRRGRRCEISNQKGDLQSFGFCSDLTTAGSSLAQTLLNLSAKPCRHYERGRRLTT